MTISPISAAIRDNPSAGNYEELGDLYMDDGKTSQAREAFNKAIAARADTPDPFYRRAVCALQMGDAAAAVPDLERVVQKEPDYDFQKAAGLLAHANGRRKCWTRNRRCPAICGEEKGLGFGRPRKC